VEVGDWAVAIGSPFGLEATVTAGIISAKGRNLGDPEHGLQRFLQTDAAINPGNSGGPLLNINGEVIGVNTMIATRTGAFDGVGFALPMNLAVGAYNQLIKTGKVSRGAIGIRFDANVKPELMKVYGANSGVFVNEVTPGGPADRAGVHEADIVTSFNSKPVKTGDDLLSTVAETPAGMRVPVTVLRDGKPLTLTLEVGDRAKILAGNLHPGEESGEGGAAEGSPVKFGLSVENMTGHERESLDLKENGGVRVTGVDDSSFGEDLGIRRGDVILAINRQPVNSVDDVKRISGKLKAGDPVAFKVMRTGSNGRGEWQTFFAAGTLPNQSK
jgi:serine protease Do